MTHGAPGGAAGGAGGIEGWSSQQASHTPAQYVSMLPHVTCPPVASISAQLSAPVHSGAHAGGAAGGAEGGIGGIVAQHASQAPGSQ